MEEKKTGSIYELDGKVELKKALPLGIQHILAMFLGNISPLLIICGMLDMATGLKTNLNSKCDVCCSCSYTCTVISCMEGWC